MLTREQIEEQAIVRLAPHVMTLAHAADVAEMQALDQALRRIAVGHPGVDRVQAELAEPEREKLRPSQRRKAAAAKRLLPGYAPQRSRLEGPIDAVEAYDADGRDVAIVRVYPEQVRVTLRHDFEQGWRDQLPARAEIEPPVVLLTGEPARGQVDQFRRVKC